MTYEIKGSEKQQTKRVKKDENRRIIHSFHNSFTIHWPLISQVVPFG